MRPPKTAFPKLPLLLGCAALSLALIAATAKPQAPQGLPNEQTPLIGSVEGPDLFQSYCAICHGADAKGSGPMASRLKDKVPDLTSIAKNNKGQFPSQNVRKMIEGEEMAKSHGTRAMPIWGPIFHQIEYDRDWGNVRLDNLVKYLQSIQQK